MRTLAPHVVYSSVVCPVSDVTSWPMTSAFQASRSLLVARPLEHTAETARRV